MKANILIKWLIILISIRCLFISCVKEKEYLPDCTTGNCIDVNIRGLLYVITSEEKINNIPIEVFFYKRTGEWYGEIQKIISGKTNKNGVFDFTVTIDTTFFEDYHLTVRVPHQKNYITFDDNNSYHEYSTRSFYYYNKDMLQNVNFGFYKKATLSIILKRTQTEDFEYFDVNYLFGNSPQHIAYIISGYDKTPNEIIQTVEVGADVQLKIWWLKVLKGGERNVETDSLICKQNSNNIFTINY